MIVPPPPTELVAKASAHYVLDTITLAEDGRLVVSCPVVHGRKRVCIGIVNGPQRLKFKVWVWYRPDMRVIFVRARERRTT